MYREHKKLNDMVSNARLKRHAVLRVSLPSADVLLCEFNELLAQNEALRNELSEYKSNGVKPNKSSLSLDGGKF